MQLVVQGAIALNAPLCTYLPQPYVPDDALLERVTARHVLSHTTGWPNWRPDGQPLRRDAPPGERYG
jgi:CubicO group peptidase (beta-lactamase class C family)